MTLRPFSLRRSIGVSLVASSLLAGILMLFGAPASDAARLDTHGWWWRAQTGTLVELPPPAHVPEGGLAVGRNADGATAISAVRFEIAANEVNPILKLKVAHALGGPDVALRACFAGSPWFGSAGAGTWESKPQAACGLGSVGGTLDEERTEATFPLASLALAGLLDVVIVPGGDTSTPFEISFERPSSSSLQTTVQTDSGGGDFGGPPPPPPDFFIPDSDFESFDPPALAPQFETALPAQDQQPTPDAPVSRAQERAFGTSTAGLLTEDDGDPRPVALLVLVVGIIAGAMLMREPLPTPRLLGPTAAHAGRRGLPLPEPEVRGLGRFRSERHGEVPKLF